MMKKLLLFVVGMLAVGASHAAQAFIPYFPSTSTHATDFRLAGASTGTLIDNRVLIDALIANGGPVYVPDGTYYTTGNHVMTDQIWYGSGPGHAIFKRLSGTNVMFTITGAAKLNGFTLDGNSLGGELLRMVRANTASVRDVKFQNVQGSTYAVELTGVSQYVDFKNTDFQNNYGNILFNGGYYSSFYNTKMFGVPGDYAIRFASNTGNTDDNFYSTYMEGPIYMDQSVRDIHFTNMRVRLDGMTGAWWQAIHSPGSEIGQVSLEHASIFKVVNSSYPIFDISSYQLTLNDVHIFDGSAVNLTVIQDRGTHDLTLRNFTVESPNNWLLFSTASIATGGSATTLENVNYTQGIPGTCTLSSQVFPGGTGNSPFISVRQSNLFFNISTMSTVSGKGGYIFENIFGGIDLSNTRGPVWIYNSSGTVTDPNCAAIGCIVSSFTTNTSVAGSGFFSAIGSSCTIFINPGSYDLSAVASWDSNGTTFTSTRYDLVIDSSPSGANRVLGVNQIEDLAVSTITVSQKTMALSGYPVTLTAGTSFYAVGVIGNFTGALPKVYGGIRAKRTN